MIVYSMSYLLLVLIGSAVLVAVVIASLVTCVTVDKLVDVQFARLSGIKATTGFVRGVFMFKSKYVHSQ